MSPKRSTRSGSRAPSTQPLASRSDRPTSPEVSDATASIFEHSKKPKKAAPAKMHTGQEDDDDQDNGPRLGARGEPEQPTAAGAGTKSSKSDPTTQSISSSAPEAAARRKVDAAAPARHTRAKTAAIPPTPDFSQLEPSDALAYAHKHEDDLAAHAAELDRFLTDRTEKLYRPEGNNGQRKTLESVRQDVLQLSDTAKKVLDDNKMYKRALLAISQEPRRTTENSPQSHKLEDRSEGWAFYAKLKLKYEGLHHKDRPSGNTILDDLQRFLVVWERQWYKIDMKDAPNESEEDNDLAAELLGPVGRGNLKPDELAGRIAVQLKKCQERIVRETALMEYMITTLSRTNASDLAGKEAAARAREGAAAEGDELAGNDAGVAARGKGKRQERETDRGLRNGSGKMVRTEEQDDVVVVKDEADFDGYAGGRARDGEETKDRRSRKAKSSKFAGMPEVIPSPSGSSKRRRAEEDRSEEDAPARKRTKQ